MFLFFLPAALIFALDRVSKLRVSNTMYVGQSHRVLGEFFRLTYVRNTGAAFGLFAGHHQVFVYISIAAILLVLALYFRGARQARLRSLALGLILGGALGNLYDRIRFHEVVDFFDFSLNGHHFAVFNVADSAVTVGVALLAWEIYAQGRTGRPEPALPAPPPGDAGP